MPARVAKTYKVKWSNPITMWKSSFKTGLFAYGLPLEDILVDEVELTIIRKENLQPILDKMRGDLQHHYITDTVTVGSVANALELILMQADPNIEEVRIRWD